MDEGWTASVEAEQGEDGLFTPVLRITTVTNDSEGTVRVPLNGVYRSSEDAVAAGLEAVRAMASDDET